MEMARKNAGVAEPSLEDKRDSLAFHSEVNSGGEGVLIRTSMARVCAMAERSRRNLCFDLESLSRLKEIRDRQDNNY